MESKLLRSREEYIEFCHQKSIGEISRKYNSQVCSIENGINCDTWCPLLGEYLHVTKQPVQYPCIFVYIEYESDHFVGHFVYLDDFKMYEE